MILLQRTFRNEQPSCVTVQSGTSVNKSTKIVLVTYLRKMAFGPARITLLSQVGRSGMQGLNVTEGHAPERVNEGVLRHGLMGSY